ncbi:MAG: hypothetical protein J0L58_06040 [Burkholderiales bacterium]|uniref:DUF6916 family protein n=1 Tax=Inhella sp. TaxID=1921806 RepID=UPI001ACA28EC|nr:hypothetical protein [Burkholderiales bacterium]
MLNTLTLQDFEPEQGQTIRVAGLPMQLVSATPLRFPRPGVRSGFSLLFRAQSPAPLAQGQHPVEHPRLGSMDIFLVPLGGEPAEFEAIFN